VRLARAASIASCGVAWRSHERSPRELYQQVILDHNRQSAELQAAESAKPAGRGQQPDLCGDRIQLYVQVMARRSATSGFRCQQGSGCAISRPRASLSTEAVKASAANAEAMFEPSREMLAGGENAPGQTGSVFLACGHFRPHQVRTSRGTALHAALQNRAEP